MANEGLDKNTTKNKEESQQSHRKGTKSVANRDTGKHKKMNQTGQKRMPLKRLLTVFK
jgi:hypothetical protein